MMLDRELLDALVPEYLAMAARLSAAKDARGAAPALDALRSMADALALTSLRALIEEAPLDPFTPEAGAALAGALTRHVERIAAAGTDLPLEPAGGSAGGPAGGHEAGEPPAATVRTLIVDDSGIMRRLLRDILTTDPAFEIVGEAADGEQALSAMRDLRPDLILLDIEMPVLDGIGMLRRWSLEGIGAVVIVSSAARSGEPTAIEARRLGAAAIVGKPSGALSLDIGERGAALLATARRAAGLTEDAAA